MRAYCADIAAATPKATGQVFGKLSNVYTVAELEAQNLWTRMDAKLASLGGCNNIPFPDRRRNPTPALTPRTCA